MKKFNKSQIFILALVGLASCHTYKENRTNEFFREWEKRTSDILEKQPQNKIEKNIKELSSIVFCGGVTENTQERFPKLEYRIVQEQVKVSMYKELLEDKYYLIDLLNSEKVMFKDLYYDVKLACDEGDLKPLILTKKYRRRVVGRRPKYGFASPTEEQKNENTRTFLRSHHSVRHYTIPYRTDEIIFNKTCDSAIVATSSTYQGSVSLYINHLDGWRYEKTLESYIE